MSWHAYLAIAEVAALMFVILACHVPGEVFARREVGKKGRKP